MHNNGCFELVSLFSTGNTYITMSQANEKGKERKVVASGVKPRASGLSSVAERWRLKPGFDSQWHHLSFFPISVSKVTNGPDCLQLDDHDWSSDCGGALSIGLPML